MAPLIILLVSFGVLGFLNLYVLKRFSKSYAGRTSLAIMLLFTGAAHFFKTEAMVQSMPAFLPYKPELVYFTGVLELAAAIGLCVERTARLTAFLLIVFFIAVLPANIIGSYKQVELGGMENGPVYLWFRIPLQLFFIWWAFYFGIRNKGKVSTANA